MVPRSAQALSVPEIGLTLHGVMSHHETARFSNPIISHAADADNRHGESHVNNRG